MYVKIKFQKTGELVNIAKFSGMAPCQILNLNKATIEEDLVGQEILVKMNSIALRREVGWYWQLKDGKINRVAN
ncbi:MAG: hypothetical protein FWE45_04155 [Firmicutes bacterium]|nr:hypothetical protein [Bacillota bacterium]